MEVTSELTKIRIEVSVKKEDKTITIPVDINLQEKHFQIQSGKDNGYFLFKECHHPNHDIHIIETILESDVW